MASLPIEVLYGLYLGVLTGIVPALVAWTLGFAFKYFTGVTVPGLGVVALSVAIAGANGGLLALSDPTVTGSELQARLSVALLVVLMITLYAHSAGDRMGGKLPRRLSLRTLTERTLSTDVVELVGGRGTVRVTVAGEVTDLESYPPMPADLRAAIRDVSWTFPADLPLSELETRVADRLRMEFDLTDAAVRLDERARATVSAAPPTGGLSKRIPSEHRAVSVETLVPTGLARGDEVVVDAGGSRYAGTVVSVATGGSGATAPTAGTETETAVDGESDEAAPRPAPRAPATAGGEGRVTLAVRWPDAEPLLAATVDRIAVRSRGVRREFEVVSLLRRGGKRFWKLTVREGAALDETSLGDASVRDAYGVVVLAVRHEGRWTLAPRGTQTLAAGDDLFAVGSRERLAAFQEAVA